MDRKIKTWLLNDNYISNITNKIIIDDMFNNLKNLIKKFNFSIKNKKEFKYNFIKYLYKHSRHKYVE